jgi:hypothetical protein
MYIAPSSRGVIDLVRLLEADNFLLKFNQVNWDLIFSGIILFDSCEKALCKVKSGEPKCGGSLFRLNPFLKHLYS